MKRLVVNADDFGLTEMVNQGILKCHQEGIVTSASLLANGLALESAVRLARGWPSLGIGVHLNLTQEEPVSPPSLVPSLVGRDGKFIPSPLGLIARLVAGRSRLVEIERELRAQIEKVVATGLNVTHLDGHKHIHLLPAIFEIALKLAREYGIRGIRCPAATRLDLVSLASKNLAHWPSILKQHLLARALSACAAKQRHKVEEAGLVRPLHLYGVAETGFLDGDRLEAILRHLPEGSSEIMCHPGYPDPTLSRLRTRLLEQRAQEVVALTRPAIRRLLTELQIDLVNYGDLSDAVREPSPTVG